MKIRLLGLCLHYQYGHQRYIIGKRQLAASTSFLFFHVCVFYFLEYSPILVHQDGNPGVRTDATLKGPTSTPRVFSSAVGLSMTSAFPNPALSCHFTCDVPGAIPLLTWLGAKHAGGRPTPAESRSRAPAPPRSGSSCGSPGLGGR